MSLKIVFEFCLQLLFKPKINVQYLRDGSLTEVQNNMNKFVSQICKLVHKNIGFKLKLMLSLLWLVN